jgi:integrase
VAQKGFVYRSGPNWFLKYRDKRLVDGVLVTKQECVKLAAYGDRYRRESDLADLAAEKLAGVRAVEKCPQSSELFVDYVEDTWLPFVERSKKPSTYAAYRSYWLRYIKPRVEGYVLRDFTVAVVSRLLEDAATSHTLNVDTVGKIRSIISSIFTYAMGKGHFPGRSAADNPASCALIPESATQPEETVAATHEDVKKILAHLAEKGKTLERTAIAVLAYTGCRPGEARGLRWEEWDRSGAQIKIVRSVWHAIEGSPKNRRGERFVTVTEDLRSILLETWKSQGSPFRGYILANKDRSRVNLDNLSKRSITPTLALDKTLPKWTGWYSIRRFHGTQVRHKSKSGETAAKALGNTKDVLDKHLFEINRSLAGSQKSSKTGYFGANLNLRLFNKC